MSGPAAQDPGRNPDGTFKSGNDAASTMADTVPVDTDLSGLSADVDPNRNPDGTFKAASAQSNPSNFANRPKEEVQELAKEGGHASGHHKQ